MLMYIVELHMRTHVSTQYWSPEDVSLYMDAAYKGGITYDVKVIGTKVVG